MDEGSHGVGVRLELELELELELDRGDSVWERLCASLFTIMLRYYCTNLTTEGLWLLDRAKVFTVAPLLVQTISLGDKVLPPPSIARHAGFWSGSMFTMIVFRCLVRLPCRGSGVS